MNITLTGRHMDITDALRSYADKKLDRLRRMAQRVSEIEVILSDENQKHRCEIILRIDNAPPMVVHETGDDMYACLDGAVDKIERQLARHKERTRNHKGRTGAGEATAGIIETQE
ncbi:MAG: ribosome-associated translation inhibitor RaiA [Sedimentisphaerales bacterium]|nr:ribosome-associated translation inhibitor RaiA [Sedimentisphaerales bacterium]